MPPDLTISEARTRLSGPLKFGDPEQISAVEKIDKSGDRSSAQHRAWVARRARFRKRVRLSLMGEIFPCPHCGRVPWMIKASCASYVMSHYGMSGRQCVPAWFVEFAREWFAEHGGRLRLIRG